MYIKIILQPRIRPSGRTVGVASAEGTFASIDAALAHYRAAERNLSFGSVDQFIDEGDWLAVVGADMDATDGMGQGELPVVFVRPTVYSHTCSLKSCGEVWDRRRWGSTDAAGAWAAAKLAECTKADAIAAHIEDRQTVAPSDLAAFDAAFERQWGACA